MGASRSADQTDTPAACLEFASRVEPTGEPGDYRGEFHREWEIWGPAGGYIASLALRAVGHHCGRARPAVITGHFVGGAVVGPVAIACRTVRDTRVATSVHVEMYQRAVAADGVATDRLVFTAMVWGVDDDLPALEHSVDWRPTGTPLPGELKSTRELMPDQPSIYNFWERVERRPIQWHTNWETREAGPPIRTNWYRFDPTATFADPWTDACRSLIVIDVDAWGATLEPHPGEHDVIAPTIEVTARFHLPTHAEEWLLSVAEVPVAHDGLAGHHGEVWTTDGRLAASGGSTLLFRPASRLTT